MPNRLDTPQTSRRFFGRRSPQDDDRVGRVSEGIAYFFGTPRFLVYLTLFCAFWLIWNSTAPEAWRFDSREFGFTLLTLMLSLQASYSAPLILLAQNRQVDRDRVTAEQDRQRAERNLADTEYLTREILGLRQNLNEVATRDFVRTEMRNALEEIIEGREQRIRELEAELAGLAQQRSADDTPDAPDGAATNGASASGASSDDGDHSSPGASRHL